MADFIATPVGVTPEQMGSLVNDAMAQDLAIRGAAIKSVVEWAACRGINEIAGEIYKQSQIEVPEAWEHDEIRWPVSLAESGRYPGNDAELAAIPAKPFADVVYDTPYAMAQHEGVMDYERNGKQVHWEVQNYSKATAKPHYLSDPFKAFIPQLETVVGENVAAALKAFEK